MTRDQEKQLFRELAKYTKCELAKMVAELTKGKNASDIHHMTGLEIDRCETITEAGHSLAQVLWPSSI